MTGDDDEIFRGMLGQIGRNHRRIAERFRDAAALEDAMAAEAEAIARGVSPGYVRTPLLAAQRHVEVDAINEAGDHSARIMKSLRSLYPDACAEVASTCPPDVRREAYRLECAHVPIEELRRALEKHRRGCRDDECEWHLHHEAILAERIQEEAVLRAADNGDPDLLLALSESEPSGSSESTSGDS